MAKYVDLTLPFDGRYRFGIEFYKDRTHEIDRRQSTRYAISAHAFTHIDAPLHFVPNGKSIDTFPVDYFFGDAVLLDIPKGENEAITADEMEKAGGYAKGGDISNSAYSAETASLLRTKRAWKTWPDTSSARYSHRKG